MRSFLKKTYNLLFVNLPTLYNSMCSGIPFDSTHIIVGKIKSIGKTE